MNRREFMDTLKNGLNFLPPQELSEIIDEFEQHFHAGLQQGRSEQELIEQLGDPNRIVESYKAEVLERPGAAPESAAGQPSREQPESEPRRSGGSYGPAVSIHESYPADAVRAIKIRAVDSDIIFETGDGPDVRVDIEGTSSGTIRAELQNGVLSVRHEFRLFRLFHWKRDPEFRITLPSQFTGALDMECVSGNIRLPGFKGQSLRAQTVSGSIKLGDIYVHETLSMQSVSSPVRMGKSMAERIKVRNTSGSTKLDSLATNQLDIESVSGRVETAGGAVWEAKRLQIKTVSGDVGIVLNDHWRQMSFGTVSGDIELTLPEDSGRFDVELQSMSGKLKNELGRDAHADRLIRANTISGDVRIKKG